MLLHAASGGGAKHRGSRCPKPHGVDWIIIVTVRLLQTSEHSKHHFEAVGTNY